MNTKNMENFGFAKELQRQQDALSRVEGLRRAKQARNTQGNSTAPKLPLVHTTSNVPGANSRPKKFPTFLEKSQPPDHD